MIHIVVYELFFATIEFYVYSCRFFLFAISEIDEVPLVVPILMGDVLNYVCISISHEIGVSICWEM
jgi:hypothetical protein